MTDEALRFWLAEYEMTWPQIFDGQAWSGHLPTLYGVPAIPFPVMIDAEGRVVAARGSARGDELKRAVRELLRNQARPGAWHCSTCTPVLSPMADSGQFVLH